MIARHENAFTKYEAHSGTRTAATSNRRNRCLTTLAMKKAIGSARTMSSSVTSAAILIVRSVMSK